MDVTNFDEEIDEEDDDKDKQEDGSGGGTIHIPTRTNRNLVAPDGSWGWLVALGGCIVTMLLSSLGSCFGILFSRYLLELGASSALTAWIFNSQLFIWHLMGPLVGPLSAEFGWRPIGFTGVLLCSASIVISAFSPSAAFLLFSFSLLSGVGGGLVVSMCYIIVPQYFTRRRGLANALMMVGLCMGQILGAPFVKYLQDQLGFIGSTLVFGAIILNGCVGVAFFHPVAWHLKMAEKGQGDSVPEGERQLLMIVEAKKNIEENKNELITPILGETLSDENCKIDSYDDVPVNGPSEMLTDSEGNHRYPPDSASSNKKPQVDSISNCSTAKISSDAITKAITQGPMKMLKVVERVARSAVCDLKILRQRRALVIAFSNMLCMNAYFNFVMMVPFAMQAADFTLQHSAWCITAMGVSNLLSRIVISIMSDWSRFNMRLCCMTGYAILTTVMFAFPLIKEALWLVVVMGVFGCGLAATISLLHLTMVKFMGVEKLAPTFGSTCLFIGFGFPVFGPLTGFVRDYSESYEVSMWILSAMSFTAFLLWLFMPAAVSYDAKMMMKNTDESRGNICICLKEKYQERDSGRKKKISSKY